MYCTLLLEVLLFFYFFRFYLNRFFKVALFLKEVVLLQTDQIAD